MTIEQQKARMAGQRLDRAELARERLEEQLRHHDVAAAGARATSNGTVVLTLTTHETHRLAEILAAT